MRRNELIERRLTFHQLRIFKSVVDHQSFTRAADALNLSQPGVTHQIQALSETVGHPLFQPGHGRLALTAVGSALYARSRQILGLVTQTEAEIDDIAGLRGGSVRLAAEGTAGSYLLPDALATFQRAHRDVHLNLQIRGPRGIWELLHWGEVDLGVAGEPPPSGELKADRLCDEQLLCFSAPDHPLAARQPLTPADLAAGPLLTLDREAESTYVAEAQRLRGRAAPATMELPSAEAMKRVVASGHGVGVLSRPALGPELLEGTVRVLEVEGFPLARPWYLVWHRDRLQSPAIQAFVDLLRASRWGSGAEVLAG